jgi:hypothetical protein
MKKPTEHCAECWCELTPGMVAQVRFSGELVYPACAARPPVATSAREGAYSDGR